MHLRNSQNTSVYKTLLQTYHRLAFPCYLGISDFIAVPYLNKRKKQRDEIQCNASGFWANTGLFDLNLPARFTVALIL